MRPTYVQILIYIFQKNLQVWVNVCDGLAKDDARELEKVACRMSLFGVENADLEEEIQTRRQTYKQLRKDALAAAKDRNFDQLNHALRKCVAVNLQYRGDVEAAMDILMELCEKGKRLRVKYFEFSDFVHVVLAGHTWT